MKLSSVSRWDLLTCSQPAAARMARGPDRSTRGFACGPAEEWWQYPLPVVLTVDGFMEVIWSGGRQDLLHGLKQAL